MKGSLPATRRKVFYGYWIVAVTFLCLVMMSGAGNFVYSLFVKPLGADLGWSRGEVMIGFTIFFGMVGIASPLVGRMVDRHGARLVIPAGAVVMGLGFVLLSVMDKLALFYLGYVLVGTGGSAMGPVATSAVVSNWFEKKRGTAIGLMSTGIGVGGLILAPLVGFLISHVGWRHSYLALAFIIWVSIIPLSLLVIRTKPAEKGLYADGVDAPEAPPPVELSAPDAKHFTLRAALGTLAFWLIAITFISSNFSNMGAIQAQVPYLDDIGFPLGTAATALGSVGLGSAVGKFIFGWLCDRIKPKHACAIGLVLQLAAIIVLLNVRPTWPLAAVWLYALVLGLSVGSWLPTMSMLVSTTFGLTCYGAIFGAVNFIQNFGTGSGPLMAGYLYDSVGSYYWAFVIFAALYAVAIPAVLLVRQPVKRS